MTVFRHVVLVLMLLLAPQLCAADITIWYSHQSESFIEGLVSRFEQETATRVSLVQFEPEKIKAEIILGAQYGGVPDLIFVPSDFLGLYRQMQLEPIPEQWLSTELAQDARETALVDGSYWGVPIIQGNHLMLFYNKQYVANPATSWKSIRTSVTQFQQLHLMPVGWNYSDMYYLVPFLSAFNGRPIYGDLISLNTPAMVQALNFYHQLAQDNVVDGNCDYNCSQKLFIKGETAYAINGDWAYQDLKRELGDNLGVTLLPTVEGKVMHPMKSTFVFAIPEKSRDGSNKKEHIRHFLKFVQRKDNQEWVYQSHRLLPVDQKLFNQVVKQATGDELVILKQLQLAEQMPSLTAMAIAWQAMKKGYLRFKDGLSAEEAAAYMQQLAFTQQQRLQN
ncbi:sugar ABC transporter substrate-binding protein [Photobacterium lipolyticum]|nr:extracellular solute-binding protein [Photobacterium lipolyticum]